jgi:hypothetical protein
MALNISRWRPPAKPLEQPPQQIPTGQRDAYERDADGQVLSEFGLEPEPWEHTICVAIART